MLHPLLRVLVEALVSKSHNLLQEEMCLSVYSMAAVHFPSYHQQFVLQYLSGVEGLADTHRSILAQQYKMVEVGPARVERQREREREAARVSCFRRIFLHLCSICSSL